MSTAYDRLSSHFSAAAASASNEFCQSVPADKAKGYYETFHEWTNDLSAHSNEQNYTQIDPACVLSKNTSSIASDERDEKLERGRSFTDRADLYMDLRDDKTSADMKYDPLPTSSRSCLQCGDFVDRSRGTQKSTANTTDLQRQQSSCTTAQETQCTSENQHERSSAKGVHKRVQRSRSSRSRERTHSGRADHKESRSKWNRTEGKPAKFKRSDNCRGKHGAQNGTSRKHRKNLYSDWIMIMMYMVAEKGVHVTKWFLLVLLDILLIFLVLLTHAAVSVCGFVSKCTRYFANLRAGRSQHWSNQTSTDKFTGEDLQENIELPVTGKEAMQRLLSCQRKNPYSILGVTPEASDEDIKKYYRRQAVLVHPDKNKQPGAEEAFKILAHAFVLIGEPENRRKYDIERETKASQACMDEFQDLMARLNEKMQEAANVMRCDSCGKTHQRVPTQRPIYAARFCRICDIYHSAKEGDLWAESKWLGFFWHYYACMEGNIYDVTTWACCQGKKLGKLQPNGHQVQIRLSTGYSRNKHHNSNEANLEDFLKHLFSQTTQQQQQATSGAEGHVPPDHNHESNAAAKKGSRKKKTLGRRK